MTKFIVPTDFSATALQALRFTGALSQRCGAQVHILHAYILLENIYSEGKTMRDAWNQQQQAENVSRLLELKQYMREEFPNVYVETHLFTGPTEDAILRYADKQEADMIIMGTQGASGLAKVLVGSVTADLMARSGVPVLAVPEKYKEGTPAFILLAVRDFDEEQKLLKPVFFLASLWDIPVQVMVYVSEEDEEVVLEENFNRLEAYVAGLQKKHPLTKVVGEMIEGEDFFLAIDDYLEETGNGLVCMITYKRGFWESIFRPSLTKEVAYHTRIPLLAIPAQPA
jgi:nucleotide-binding universal stress UspA family protein